LASFFFPTLLRRHAERPNVLKFLDFAPFAQQQKKEHENIEIIVFMSVLLPRPKNKSLEKCTEILGDLISGYTKES